MLVPWGTEAQTAAIELLQGYYITDIQNYNLKGLIIFKAKNIEKGIEKEHLRHLEEAIKAMLDRKSK